MSAPTLKGMTWSHPRGYDPMVACSAIWQKQTGVTIEWDKRSLQDFESFPVEELARAYDLIVIDHPHVGQITSENCVAPLDIPGRENDLQALADGTVGQSFPSYNWQGHQWAFPIDAAAQVQAWRPDLLEAAPTRWEDILALAKAGKVLLPLRPPHSLMSYYTLCANLGAACDEQLANGTFIDAQIGAQGWDMLREITDLIDPVCLEMDPIAVSEKMAESGSKIACAPLIYGYVSYALDGFRANRLSFADIPAAGENGPIGSALGGTGIAVSAFSKARQEAIDFAYWVASGDVQRGPYASAGGQPGHAKGWEDAEVNAATGDFYRNTRKTLETAWVRPRHDGYMVFQQEASDRINEGLLQKHSSKDLIGDLEALYRKSLPK